MLVVGILLYLARSSLGAVNFALRERIDNILVIPVGREDRGTEAPAHEVIPAMSFEAKFHAFFVLQICQCRHTAKRQKARAIADVVDLDGCFRGAALSQ